MSWATVPKTSELFRTPLVEKPPRPPPRKESTFRACLSDVSQARAVRWGKATVSSTTCQRPHIQVGNFKAWSSPAPSDVHNSWECTAFLNFREAKSSPSLKGDTEPLGSSCSPRWRGPGPCGGAWARVSRLCTLERAPLSPACQSRPRDIRQLLLIETGSTSSLSLLKQLPPLSCARVPEEFSLPQQPKCLCIQCKWTLHTSPFIEHYHQSLRLEI